MPVISKVLTRSFNDVQTMGENALYEAFHSKNEPVSAYAATVLHRIGKDKPVEYQKRLSLQLTSSIYRDDSMPYAHAGMTDPGRHAPR